MNFGVLGTGMPNSSDITSLLQSVARGDDGADGRLFALVYGDLRAQASRQLAGRASSTLQATALVHEAYLRLFGGELRGWENRRHFFFAAARAMRDVAVEHARKRGARKRGGDRRREDVDAVQLAAPLAEPGAYGVLEVDDALTRLRAHDAMSADVVLLRLFGGLTHDQVAEVLGIAESRVRREWTYARAWLREHMQPPTKP